MGKIPEEAALAAAAWWADSMLEPAEESERKFFIDVLISRIEESEGLPELKRESDLSSVLFDTVMESGIDPAMIPDHTEMVLDADEKILARSGEHLPWEQVWPEAEKD